MNVSINWILFQLNVDKGDHEEEYLMNMGKIMLPFFEVSIINEVELVFKYKRVRLLKAKLFF